jgi:hypothetical protein
VVPSTRDAVARVSSWLGVKASDSSSMLDSESIEASDEEVDIFFLLYGFVDCIYFLLFSDLFIAMMADLSNEGLVRLKRLLPDVIVLIILPVVPPI